MYQSKYTPAEKVGFIYKISKRAIYSVLYHKLGYVKRFNRTCTPYKHILSYVSVGRRICDCF